MKLFRIGTDPETWVGEDPSGALMEWPARQLGYQKRTPYQGRRRDLVQVDPRLAARTGWPGCPRGPIPRGGKAATTQITIRLTDAERAAWERAAGERPIADWARRIVNGTAGVAAP